MQELRQEAGDRKKAKPVVGTAKNESLNYLANVPAFDQTHVPARAALIKSEVKFSILPDILGRQKQSWNTSVLLDRKRKYDEQVNLDQLHFEIRKGLRDISQPPPSNTKIYEGVDTRNSFANWNVSVQFSPLDHKKQHQSVTNKARYNSAVKTKEMLSNKPYIKPIDRQLRILEEIRTTKEKDFSIKAEIMKEVVHENPDISQEKATAVVHKLVENMKVKSGQEELYGVKSETFKPDLSVTIKKKLERKSKHDGIFQFNEALQKQVWSCCIGEEENSPGCVVSYKNNDKWQLISF